MRSHARSYVPLVLLALCHALAACGPRGDSARVAVEPGGTVPGDAFSAPARDGRWVPLRGDAAAAASTALTVAAPPATTSELKTYRFLPAADPSRFDTELDSRTVKLLSELDFARTVVVAIDVWPNAAPDPVANNVRVFLDLARRKHVKIVHAPTGTLADIDPRMGAVDEYPNEWVSPWLDHVAFDRFLDDFGIENILYVGFNNGWCVFYKPLGMSMQHQRTPDRNLILVKDATDSWNSLHWVNEWANNAAEHKFASTTIADVAEALSEQVTLEPFAATNLSDEGYAIDAAFGFDEDPRRMALVVVNPWAAHENDGWEARLLANNRERLAPLLDTARHHEMKVLYVSNERAIDPAIAPRAGEPVFTDKDALWRHLAEDRPDGPVAAAFDGGTYVDLGNDPHLWTDELTIELTAVDRNPAPNRKLLSFHKSVGTPNAAYQLRTGEDGTSLYYQFFAGGQWNTVIAPGFFTPGEQVDVAVTHDRSGDVWVYRNGVVVAQGRVHHALDYSDTVSLRLGARAEKEFWQGSIANVRLWSVARDAASVRRDRDATLAGDEPGLVGAWKLDEPGGAVARDASRFRADGAVVRGSNVRTLVYAGNVTNEARVFTPFDAWALTGFNGGATDPYGWENTKYASRLLEDAIIAFESPESLAGEHFKKTFLSRAVAVYGGTRHQVSTAAILAKNLQRNPRRPIWLEPGMITTPPKGSIALTATGGSGAGYRWSIARNGSGGTIGSGGVYTAGATGDTTDVVEVTDSLGQRATRTITVGRGVIVHRDAGTLPPRGGLTLRAEGGSGAGFTWSLATNASGGSVNPSTGAYVAGRNADVTDVVQVTDSLGNVAVTAMTVTAGLSATPRPASVPPRGTLALAATGGSGAGFRWSLVASPSGGSIDPSSGEFAAGATPTVTDIVQLTDSLGNVLTLEVNVGAAISVAPSPPGVAPREALALQAIGGAGGGFHWLLAASPSGGTIDALSGRYAAGPIGGVTDVVHVIDPLGNHATLELPVGPELTIAAPPDALAPRGTHAFEASGGSGVGLTWALATNGSGGSIDPETGAYRAGATGNVFDAVEVTDSFGNTATHELAITNPLVLSPSTAAVASGARIAFERAGGAPGTLVWSLERNDSGATLERTGAYTAGPAAGTDRVTVTDANGNVAAAAIAVARSPERGGCGSSGGAATAWSWLVPVLVPLVARRRPAPRK
jgi:hypothetical protein